MTKVAGIEQQVGDLTPQELAKFRKWFAQFDAADWDRQFESDANAGKLDLLAERALQDHAAGRSTKL